jgi:hypothetical protein
MEYRVGVWRMGFREEIGWLPGIGYIDGIEWRSWTCWAGLRSERERHGVTATNSDLLRLAQVVVREEVDKAG